MPAGTSTELFKYGTLAMTSAEGELLDRRGGRVCGEANGYDPNATIWYTPELQRQLRDGAGERSPLRVGFRTHQREHRVAVDVRADLQFDVAPHQAGVDALAQLHRGAPCAVVDEGVAVEDRKGLRVARGVQRSHGGGRRTTGVDPAVEVHHQHRPVERGERPGEFVARVHGCCSSAARRSGSCCVDLLLERLELGFVAHAECTAEVAGVHALEDARQLPVGERHVERQVLRSRPLTCA
jgi:hypothetical protein